MNSLRNSVRLIGHLGDDPKVRKLDSGKTVANFSVATNEIYRDNNGNKQSETTWHRLVAWGKLTNRQWEDKNGEKQYSTEIVVNSLLMLDKASS